MSHRYALIIAVQDYPNVEPLAGAAADARDLYRTLLGMGLDPAHIRVLGSPDLLPTDPSIQVRPATAAQIRAGVQWLAEHLRSDDDTALIHFSGRGLTHAEHGPCLAAHGATADQDDHLVPVQSLLDPLRATPIRSVLTVLDAGFGDAPAHSRALPGAPPVQVWPQAGGDPVITANGPRGPVFERTLGGEPRGMLSWALARALETLPADPSWTFDALLVTLRRALGAVRAHQLPGFSPGVKAELPLGSWLQPGPAHVPWRGVQAAWQFETDEQHLTEIGSGTALGQLLISSHETWVWVQSPWTTAGFQGTVTSLTPGNPGQGTVYNFTNNGFGNQGSSTAPQVSTSDRVFQVDVPGANGHQVWLIVRQVQNPTRVEWYTTLPNTTYLPVAVNDVLTFQPAQIDPQQWQQHTWYRAAEARQ